MATWQDVSRLAEALPQTDEDTLYGNRAWKVRKKAYAWERPLARSDLSALGDAAPDGPILAASVADLGVREGLLAEAPDVYFTTPHFAGYPAVLVRLDQIGVEDLDELLTEAWLARAPPALVKEFLAAH